MTELYDYLLKEFKEIEGIHGKVNSAELTKELLELNKEHNKDTE